MVRECTEKDRNLLMEYLRKKQYITHFCWQILRTLVLMRHFRQYI